MIASETDALRGDILLCEGPSQVTYHEYVTFAKPRARQTEPAASPSETTDSTGPPPTQVVQSILSADGSGDELFGLALRRGYGLDQQGEFKPLGDHADPAFEGRVRQIICRRRDGNRPDESDSGQGLQITDDDYMALNLHPATLQYVRRVTTESMFWDRRHENLYIILCFSSDPRPPYDFFSFTYSISQRTATMLIRQSHDGTIHDVGQLGEYAQRMRACEAQWAHPLVTPAILLQVQFALSERAVADNEKYATTLEHDVERMAGFENLGSGPRRRQSNFSTTSSTWSSPPPKRPTELIKNAYDVFKKSIKLLDTIKWMERAVSVLLEAGDALDDVHYEAKNDMDLPSPGFQSPGFQSRGFQSPPGRTNSGFSRARIVEEPMSAHWHEIRQYLESLQRLCQSLETDRHMLEVRCKAQIDIIYAKIQQEDNILTARMAVTSTRDSSSLKALAVITALFLPGEFIASMLGMSMFELWNDAEYKNTRLPSPPRQLWLYWATAIPLTVVILVIWRLWWVAQDRFFRTHLSKELSEERYWTEDRRPRKLEHSFIRDFFTLSARRDERSNAQSAAGGLQFSMTPQAMKTPTSISHWGKDRVVRRSVV